MTDWPKLSLMFFASETAVDPDDRYRAVLDLSQQADEIGLDAVWIPERHFHAFGGSFPNPAVLTASIAALTKNIRLRAGSVVLPLHDPIRVAEEWAMVDNLSHGRVDLAFATGWDADSFVLQPSRYEQRLDKTFELAQTVEQLWRGAPLSRTNGKGEQRAIKTHPRPVQTDLNVWITATSRTELFERAGTAGYNILTALLFQSFEELQDQITAYRTARARAGYDPETGQVSLMLHTFVGDDIEDIRETVRAPMISYLASCADLWQRESDKISTLEQSAQNDLLEIAFERYLRHSSLIGTPAHCQTVLERAAHAGVNEIACLVDFGVPLAQAKQSLTRMARLPFFE